MKLKDFTSNASVHVAIEFEEKDSSIIDCDYTCSFWSDLLILLVKKEIIEDNEKLFEDMRRKFKVDTKEEMLNVEAEEIPDKFLDFLDFYHYDWCDHIEINEDHAFDLYYSLKNKEVYNTKDLYGSQFVSFEKESEKENNDKKEISGYLRIKNFV